MRLSEGVEWGVHCATLLCGLGPEQALPAARLAEYHGIPEPYLAKHLQAMARAGILASAPGPKGGYGLTRSPEEITVLDVVEAIDGVEPAFRCDEIRRRGPTASPAAWYRLPCSIHRLMLSADEAWRAELRATTIADLFRGLFDDVDSRVLAKGAVWLQEVVR